MYAERREGGDIVGIFGRKIQPQKIFLKLQNLKIQKKFSLPNIYCLLVYIRKKRIMPTELELLITHLGPSH